MWRRHLLILGGLALCSCRLLAQDYLDPEDLRRDAASPGAPVSDAVPYPPPDRSPVAPPTAESGQFGELFYQMQLLQREVMELRGMVEQQSQEVRQLRQQSLERYQDLDRRLGEGVTTPAVAGAEGGESLFPAETTELPGEADAYRAAYSLVRSQQFADAVAAFRQFAVDYPDGRYAANAHYWLGELYLVVTPPDLESSRREFVLLTEQYPDNGRIPDALYKLGKIHFERDNWEKSREYLERVIREYEDSGSSAVTMAREFLDQNF